MQQFELMTNVNPELIGRYQQLLKADPNSKIFAPLAEALRREGKLAEAYELCSNGVRRHPEFAGGRVALAKILIDQKKWPEAREHLVKAVSIAPENLMAHHLLADSALELRRPKDALKAFKMVLFLNPQDSKAKRAVQKLEPLTADEFTEEVFDFQPRLLGEINLGEAKQTQASRSGGIDANASKPPELERLLSLSDAYLIRNDVMRAEKMLHEALAKHGSVPEIELRLERIRETFEVEQPIEPMRSRAQIVLENKVQYLEDLLQKIGDRTDRS